jgi:S-adenosylmethionine:tRNA ribosyltransferase-isomerase
VFAPADYAFDLPEELIAQQPAATRDASRLLHVGATLGDHRFPDIVDLLPRDAVIVANDTRVIPARILGNKDTGGNVELLFMEHEGDAPGGGELWRCLARARRPLRAGQCVHVNGIPLILHTERASDGSVVIAVPGDGLGFLERHGHIPLPRYIRGGDDQPADRERYQTMFATQPGAIAAPTAGLHMTPAIRDALVARGATFATVTLHVGWGTFEPIRETDIRSHDMHRERFTVPAETAKLVASGRPVVAIGTTTLRALEAHALDPAATSTKLFVYPGSGHTFRSATHLVTNFHLPESTLLMLVSAFAGTERVLAAYRHAVAQRYRFYSYGDAMLVHRDH